jgi:phosphatidylserine/phosphatidylglycerophosphate/cardiolipin synthase-like enzyme
MSKTTPPGTAPHKPDQAELDDMLMQTLDDRRLSRSERRALREVFADYDLDEDGRAFVRRRVFAMAREAITGREAHAVLDWAEDVIKLLRPDLSRDPTIAEVCFSPGDACRLRIARLLRQARSKVDICVFTITDDRLAHEILDAHQRGVAVRIITDNDKAEDKGSDVYRLGRAGVRVRVDLTEHHMHHKFAVFDDITVITGSYNWTRSAAAFNAENVIVSDDPSLVRPYVRRFNELWDELGPTKA